MIPTTVIHLGGHPFQIRRPYTPGQLLGPAEARVLNDLRAKALRKAFSPAVAEAQAAEPSGQLSLATLADLQLRFAKLDANFALRGGAPDPLEREALAVAEERVLQLAAQAQQTIDPHQLGREAALLAKAPAVLEEAGRRLAAKRQLAEKGLEALL